MKNILYVVSRPLEINTSASIRNKATITGLIENGFHVDLLTTLPDKNHTAYDSSMTIEGANTKYIELGGVQSMAKIGRKFKFLKPLHKIAIKLFQKASIYDNLQEIVNHTDEIDLRKIKYDYIISSSDPKSSHLFVEKLLEKQAKYFDGKWIQIWGDPFYDDISLPGNINKNNIYEEEKRLLSKAQKIIYVSKITLSKQKELYSSLAPKMEYIPIPYNKEIISKTQKLINKENVTIAYCGDYSSHIRNIVPLYEAINEMKGIKGTICGNSNLRLSSTENVTILPRQPYNIIENIESENDILIHLSNLNGGQIPGKIYQYSGTNKPILFILDGDCKDLKNEFERYNRFEFAENNKESIQHSISRIINKSIIYEPVLDFSKNIIARKIVKF